MPRRALASLLASVALIVVAGTARAALMPPGWAPGGVPSSPASVLHDSEVHDARAVCGENAALLVRVGDPSLLRNWSAAVGDALIRKGWSVHDLQEPGTLRAADLRDRLTAAVARCPARTILLASYGEAILPVRRATRQVRLGGTTRVTVIAEVAAGTRHVAWSRSARPFLRGLSRWPAPTLEDALTGVPQDGARLGAANAPVVMASFTDLQCPFCRDYALQVLPRLVARYVRSGEVQMRAEVVAFIGPGSLRAGHFAVAAGMQDRLWQFTDRFLQRQGEENTGYVTPDFLRTVAAGVPGLDVNAMFTAARTHAADAALEQSFQLWRRNDFTGVPSFLIGPAHGPSRPFEGSYLRPSKIEGAIQRALRDAHAGHGAARGRG